MTNVEIQKLVVLDPPAVTPGGRMVLARFDAVYCGLRLMGCTLFRNTHGGLDAYPPHVRSRGDGFQVIRFAGPEARTAIRDAARKEYELTMIERGPSELPSEASRAIA